MKLKLLLALVPSISLAATATVKSCGLENNMVDIYLLDRTNGKPWTDVENAYITTVDKTKVERYTLEQALPEGLCKIVFYFKDGSYDNTQNKWWSGYKHQYITYLSALLGLEYQEEWN